jgi:tRNA(His) guanylyltransferase
MQSNNFKKLICRKRPYSQDVSSTAIKMKNFEHQSAQEEIDRKKPYIIRLDGRKFSQLTKFFKKPFDLRIHDAMIQTSLYLMASIHPAAIYTFSDEISLLFPVNTSSFTDSQGNHFQDSVSSFFLKNQKQVSVTAGMASAKFSLGLARMLDNENTNKEILEYIENTPPHFDSRIFNVDTNMDLLENVQWRQYDCVRNSVSLLSHTLFSQKELLGLKQAFQIEKQLEKGVNWEAFDPAYKYGTFIKRKQYFKTCENGQISRYGSSLYPFLMANWCVSEDEKRDWLCSHKLLIDSNDPPCLTSS